MKQNREPRNNFKSLSLINIWQRGHKHTWSENNLFNEWCGENWTGTCKKNKMKLDHQLTLYTRINSKWIKNILSHDTIKVLEGNKGRKISDTPHSNIFTDTSPRAREIKEKINKWDYIKLQSFCTAKETILKMRREPTVWENIFANDTSHKGLFSKTYKELTWLHVRKTRNPI